MRNFNRQSSSELLSAYKGFFSSYSAWLSEENARVPIPNWIAQAIMGVMFMLVCLLSLQAILAWAHGATWNSMIQTATRHGQPVMRPIGQMILIGAGSFASGFALLLTAVFCRQRDNA